jgi:NADH-quinone oxidoreductase subunit C
LKNQFPKSLKNVELQKPGVIYCDIANRDAVLKICKFLKLRLNFGYPLSITAMDWPDNYEVIYHIVSYENNNIVELHLPVSKDDPTVESVVRVWSGANAHEREAYDMIGIIFKNHPDLRRILNPEEVDYYPLRKDFPLGGPLKEGLEYKAKAGKK